MYKFISFLLAFLVLTVVWPADLASFWGIKRGLVAHTGFEPVISALRGQRPKPLDECATLKSWGSWIRTRAHGFRVRCPTARLIPKALEL